MGVLAWIVYALIGVAAGFLGGLLGIGGGIVVVPALIWTFSLQDYQNSHLMQIAIGTSLGAMVLTSASSAWAHYLQKGIYWHLFRVLFPGSLVGAVLGALLADYLPSDHLKLIFGMCECMIGMHFLMPGKLKSGTQVQSFHPLLFFCFGVAIGALSTLLGIGGGIITVPILTLFQVPIRHAIATSAALGFFNAVIGAASFLYLGLDAEVFPGAIGYLYLPAFIIIGISASLLAPYGVKKAYLWPADVLRRIFGAVLILLGLSVIFPFY
ncbi:conserved putative membrane protein [Candidatus Protochlamydia naegleriophila]|uniref:Probable membrane transporter protein n=1 Tax=Candidatus Protochlamydia naegleriophila TaxID=389348 RepID=A0A0U5JCP5_9BACT|nr:sulfite exporter TauE/SafE family protein [Candidatus Protochlamydia naegleriophila]CUI16903.1 conserved putative membrane protein [Candidatus Protochlamydia naegleriophila]